MILNTLVLNLALNPAQFMAGLNAAKGAVAGFAGSMSMGLGLASVGVTVGLIKATEAAIEWEDAMLGAQKTIEMTDKPILEQQKYFEGLSESLLEMSTRMPVAAIDLAKMAEAAGALGVHEDEITDFVEAAATLSGLAEDVTPERAARAFGTIRTVMGLTTDEYMKFTSAVIQAGISGASTEGEILSMAERAAGQFGAMDIAVQDLAGWSAAMANVREMSEAGGTTLQRMGVIMEKNIIANGDGLKAVAQAAGVTTEAFAEMFKVDPSDAMQLWINGLAKVDDSLQRGLLLRKAGFSDIRLTRGLNKMINAVSVNLEGNLNDALSDTERGFNDQELVARMTEERWKGVAKQAEMLSNIIHKMALDIGEALLPIVALAVEHLKNLFTIVGNLIHSVPGLTAVITPLVAALAALGAIKFSANLLGMFLPTRGIGRVISATIGKKGGAGGGGFGTVLFGGFGKAISGAKKGIGGLFNLFKTGAGAAARLGSAAFLGVWMAVFAALALEWDALQKMWAETQKHVETIDKAEAANDEWLKTAPAVAEVESRIRKLKDANEDMWQGQMHGIKFITDGLSQFGIRQGVAVEDQIAKYEEYVRAVEAGEIKVRTVMSDTQRLRRMGMANAVMPQAKGNPFDAFMADQAANAGSLKSAVQALIDNGVIDPIKAGFDEARQAAIDGFGSVKKALQDKPMIISKKDRLENMAGRMKKVMAQIKKATKAKDPYSQAHWETARAKLQGTMERLRGTSVRKMGEIKNAGKKTAIDQKATWQSAMEYMVSQSQWGTSHTEAEIQSMASILAGIDLSASGAAVINSFAEGMASAIPNVTAQANAAADAAKPPLESQSPPKTGPLQNIDKWGANLVKTWAGGFGRGAHHVGAAANDVAGMFNPRLRGPALASGFAMQERRRGDCFHVGTLIADQRGLDELDRRSNKRRRHKRRGGDRENNDPN